MQLWNILHIEYCFCCETQKVNKSNPIINSFVHLQHVIISISMTLLSNTIELGLVHVCKLFFLRMQMQNTKQRLDIRHLIITYKTIRYMGWS